MDADKVNFTYCSRNWLKCKRDLWSGRPDASLQGKIESTRRPLKIEHYLAIDFNFDYFHLRFVSLHFDRKAHVRRGLSDMQRRPVVHGNAEAGAPLLRFSNMQSECMFRRTANILSRIERRFRTRYCILCLQVRTTSALCIRIDWLFIFFIFIFLLFASPAKCHIAMMHAWGRRRNCIRRVQKTRS